MRVAYNRLLFAHLFDNFSLWLSSYCGFGLHFVPFSVFLCLYFYFFPL